MELSKINIAACIVPKELNIEIGSDSTNDTNSSIYLQKLAVTSSVKDVQLTLKEDDKTIKSWIIDHAIEPDSTTSVGRQKLIDFVIKGYDVAALSVSIGDLEQLHEQRENNLLLLLNLLQSKVDHYQPIEIKLEYAYLGISDNHCYDLRKDTERSGESVNSKGGLDFIMKEVNNVNDIWIKVEQLVETPFMLVIKLTNDATNTVGRLMVFDLLHPESIYTESKYACYKAYLKLHDIIRSINGKIDLFNEHNIETDGHIILDELMKYDTINNNDTSREFIKCMDVFTKLRNIPVRMIKNKYVNRHSKEYKDKLYIEQLKEYNNSLKTINTQLKKSEDDLQSRLSLQNMVNLELKNRILFYETNEKVKEKQIELLKVARQQSIEESKLYSEALLKAVEVQRTLIDFQLEKLTENDTDRDSSKPLIKEEEKHLDLNTTKHII